MKRFLVMTVLVIVSILLQISVFPFLKLAGVTPNVVLILIVSFALMRGRAEGAVLGFVCGLILDLLSGGVVGMNALIFTVIGYLNGMLHHLFFANNILLPLGMVLASSLGYDLIMYICGFLLRNRTDFLFYLRYVIFPDVTYTFLVSVFLYNIFLWINQTLKKHEKRSIM